MKFVITAGGTAGHINPALALAEELQKSGHEVFFAGSNNRLESKLVPLADFQFRGFKAQGFNRKKPSTLLKSIMTIQNSTKDAKRWLSEIKPNAVIGFGCYVSIAICRAAKKLKIPYIIHEQNSVMGMANKYLSRNANVTCLTYKHADTGKCNNVIVTGNPVRSKVFSAKCEDGRKLLNIPMNVNVLLVFGGSLGAAHINNEIAKMSKEILSRKNLYVVHITGESQYDNVCSSINLNDDEKERYIILPYQNQMAETLAASNMVISRAGASTLAELTARSLPALLIPYPNATENHQYYNAQELFNAGCVFCIEDKNVESKEFHDTLLNLIDNSELRDKMSKAYSQFNSLNSAKKIADILVNL